MTFMNLFGIIVFIIISGVCGFIKSEARKKVKGLDGIGELVKKKSEEKEGSVIGKFGE